MTSSERAVLVAAFVDRDAARRAVNELRRANFREGQVGVLARREEEHGIPSAEVPAADAATGSKVVEGAAIGVGAGAGLGALWALGITAGVLPAIGPVIAGGVLAAVAASAAGAAAVGGIVGALVGLGVPEEEARFYENEFHRGRTLVTVKPEGRSAEAEAILRSCGGYDVHAAAGREGTAAGPRT